MRYAELTEEHLNAAAQVVAATTRRRAAWAGPGARDIGPTDLAAVGEATLRPYLDDALRVAYVARDDDGGVRAVLGGTVRHVTPQDAEFLYQPPEYLTLTTCAAVDHVAEREHLPALFDRIRRHARAEENIDRIGIAVLAADWWHSAVWRELGLRPESVFAVRPVAAPSARHCCSRWPAKRSPPHRHCCRWSP